MVLHEINFKVKGVTFKNEEGNDIQKEIKSILKEYKDNEYFTEFYGGYTNKEIKEMDLNVNQYEGYTFPAKLVGDEYNEEDCIKIYLKTYNGSYIHVGYAPKEDIEELTEWFTKENINIDGNIEITGGRYKYCELYKEYYEEKERVVVKELTYGLEVNLVFSDNQTIQEENNIPKMQEQKTSIIKQLLDIMPYIITAIISLPFIWIFCKIMGFIISFITWIFK